LTLGILSVVASPLSLCCGLFALAGMPLGIIAWVMGQGDLHKMRTGAMDPAGRGSTQTGRTLGIIGTALTGLCGGGAVVLFFFNLYAQR
jgi:hypothetical protein